jgi:outer membrane lipoprotein-sorting protein
MNKLFIAAGLFMMSMAMQAQNPNDKAKEILDKLSAKTKTFTTIYADFTFTHENLQSKKSEKHDGSIKVKGNKYLVKLMDVETYFDGKTQWTYMKDAGEVNVSTPDVNDDNSLNPAKIFTMYEKGFKFQYVGEKVEAGKNLYEIDLFPEGRDKNFSRIKLLISKDDMQLYTLKQMGKDGNNIIVKVNKMVANQAYADTDFTFNTAAHSDVDVIDMR